MVNAVERLRERREPGVLVTVASVRGHAPREAGAKLVVVARGTWGTIGGGNLEAVAIDRARELIETPARSPLFETALSDKAPYEHGVQCCGGEVTVLLEPLPVVPAVAIFGIGHVGLELARILARHDLELHLVDSRPEQLTDERLAPLSDAVARPRPPRPVLPELVLGELPPGTHVLIMTHDHAEDAALCDAALRGGTSGRSGSSARRASGPGSSRCSPPRRPPASIARITTPIGLPDIPGKDPATIAVSVAADLLLTVRARAVGRGSGHDDDVPRQGPRHPDDPFPGGALRADADAGLLVVDGRIVDAGRTRTSARAPRREVVDLRSGLVLPGFVDTHVHFPQVRAIGGLGMPLLEWLDAAPSPRRRGWPTPATPERSRASSSRRWSESGTTTALVFGAHFAPAVDPLFAEATERGLRVTCGLVVSDRMLRRGPAHDPGAGVRRGRARATLARAAATGTPSPPLLAVLQRRTARLVRGPARGPRLLVHLPRQREPGRDRQ